MTTFFLFTPLPVPGDIVWCQFPESIGVPGPKPRPALVIAVSPKDHAVRIAYGTSQKTDKIYKNEFVLDPKDIGFNDSGLTTRTKFDLSNTVQVPFNSIWFSAHKGVYASTPLPKMGVLHPSYMPKLQSVVNSKTS